jgi:hypothetical protein
MKKRDYNTIDTGNYERRNFIGYKQSETDTGLILVCLHKYTSRKYGTKDFKCEYR